MSGERVVGSQLIIDCATGEYEFLSADFIHSHLKALSMMENKGIKTHRYEEETFFELDEEKTKMLWDYIGVTREVEKAVITPKTYGRPDDDGYPYRKKVLTKIHESMFQNPLLTVQYISDYDEKEPQKSSYLEGYMKFKALLDLIRKKVEATKLYALTKEQGDLRAVFISLMGLKSMGFVSTLQLERPPEAKDIADKESGYELGYGVRVKVYNLEKSEANLYTQENPVLEGLSEPLKKMLRKMIARDMQPAVFDEAVDYTTLFDTKMMEYRQEILNQAGLEGIDVTPEQALVMGREAASWTVGLGAPIENMSLDRSNITDVYIDSENSPMYIEHAKFGLCHTLWRYNKDLMEHMIRNIMGVQKTRKFDQKNPIADIMLTRLNMRCHIQGPPATFGELQAALRMTKESPFTYAQYLYYNSMSPFFAGYDDLMVSLGNSEAVLGLKGVGKTAFTAAKIVAIGTKKRILPIQDIEEIPTRAYRKRGFHIGAMKVMSSDKEEEEKGSELSLISMAGASLRMGDSALIINEVRSKTAIQGIINLLNTQPGVFCLYNLHAQSLKDIQDRLELVFNVPAAAMFATDRYSFLKKIRFGRKGRVYRVLGQNFESDVEKRQFLEIFEFQRDGSIENCVLACKFLDNPEANYWDLSEIKVAEIGKRLKIKFVPPALARRSAETSIPPEQYVLQAFFKGKVYSQILKAAKEYGNNNLLEVDFVLKCSSNANKLLKEKEAMGGIVDYSVVEPIWEELFKKMVAEELAKMQKEKDEARQALKKGKPEQIAAIAPETLREVVVSAKRGIAQEKEAEETAKPEEKMESEETTEEREGEKPKEKPKGLSKFLKKKE